MLAVLPKQIKLRKTLKITGSVHQGILRETQALQDLETLEPTKDEESRTKFRANFDWKHSTLAPSVTERIEELVVEFHDISAHL